MDELLPLDEDDIDYARYDYGRYSTSPSSADSSKEGDYCGSLRDDELSLTQDFPTPPGGKTVGERKTCQDDSDTSDVEDLTNLLQLSKGFTDKIKEKTETINLYKKLLLNSRIQLIKREAAYQRKVRRLLLGDKIRAIRNRENTAGGGNIMKDALFILPEEIWSMVLRLVTDDNDIQSCAKVCKLFERLLEKSKTQWLFEKILPFIFNKLRTRETLTCRSVCKTWCSSVDHFLENYYTIKSDTQTNSDLVKGFETTLEVPHKLFHFGYTFSIPPPPGEDIESSSSSSSDNDDQESYTSSQMLTHRLHDGVRRRMNLHPKNPFVGRSVTIEEKLDGFDLIPDQAYKSNFPDQSFLFFQDFGRHIWHLTISCQLGSQSPIDVYEVCRQSLVNCGNLRTLCVNGSMKWWQGIGQSNQFKECSLPADNPKFIWLKVDICNPKILIIQDKLVEKFRAQLKKLEVQVWNPDVYANYEWLHLLELHISKGSAKQNMLSLKRMRAPCLRRLRVHLDNSGPYLQTLLELSNHFPKLSHLDLKFDSRFGGILDEEVMMLPVDLTSSASLISLEISSCLTNLSSYNFLMYFPFLQRLLIRHGHWSRFNLEVATALYLDPYHPINSKSNQAKEIIKLSKFIRLDNMDAKQMYKSNVWNVLPFLQVLEVLDARSAPEIKKVYTRQGYEYYHRNDAF